MRSIVRTHLTLLGAGFRSQGRYLSAAFGGLVANTTFGFLKAVVLGATVAAAGGSLNGYDAGAMAAYIWVGQGILGSINLNGHSLVADRIKNGDVTIDFLRPLNVQTGSIAAEVGESLFALIPRGVPALLIGILLGGAVLPRDPRNWLAGALALLLGVVIACATVYLVAVAGFWLVETRGLQILYMVVSGFLAGLFVPITLFPTWLYRLAQATPFPAMMQYPIDVLTGRVQGLGALAEILQQCAWLAIVLAVGHLLTRAGRHRLEVQGG